MKGSILNISLFILSLLAINTAAALNPDKPVDIFNLSLSDIMKLRFEVTSQKRPESLQEVPNAITLISGDQLVDNNAYSIENLATLVPSLSFRKAGTPLNSSLFLRGIGTINFSIAAEPSVALVQDGVVMSRSGETFYDLFDVKRVEVLSGPQGTLFGKNASAGVVSVVSNMPGNTLASQLDTLYTQDGEYRINGSADLPLTKNLVSRVAVYSGNYDGNIHNLYNNDDINGYDHYGMRGILRWDVIDDLRLTLIADKRNADDDCCVQIIGQRALPGPNRAALDKLYTGIDLDGDSTREVRNNLTERTQEEAQGVLMQADWSLEELTVTSITSSRDWDNHEIREHDLLDTPAAYVGNDFAQIHDDGPQQISTLSQELRITSPQDGFFSYVTGLYFYDTDADRKFTRDDVLCTESNYPADETGLAPCISGFSTIVYPRSTAHFGADGTNYAAFGQGKFNLTESISAILGLRYTKDKLSYYHRRTSSPFEAAGIRTDSTDFHDSSDNKNLSGKAGVEWQINNDLMTYATYTRGYKGPAYNVYFNMNINSLALIDEETVDAYEVGLKSSFLENQAVVNLAIYQAFYKNFQANDSEFINTLNISRLINAGKVSTQGAELSIIITPVENLNISAGVAYTDAKVEQFNPSAQSSWSGSRSGEPLPYAPEWKTSLLVDYRWVLTQSPVDMVFNGAIMYSDSQYAALGADEALKIDAYSNTDISIGVADKKDRYQVSLFVNNLTDESYSSLIEKDGPGLSYNYMVPRDADRYVGIRFSLRYDSN